MLSTRCDGVPAVWDGAGGVRRRRQHAVMEGPGVGEEMEEEGQ